MYSLEIIIRGAVITILSLVRTREKDTEREREREMHRAVRMSFCAHRYLLLYRETPCTSLATKLDHRAFLFTPLVRSQRVLGPYNKPRSSPFLRSPGPTIILIVRRPLIARGLAPPISGSLLLHRNYKSSAQPLVADRDVIVESTANRGSECQRISSSINGRIPIHGRPGSL